MKIFNEPKDDYYLWRYIKPQYIDSFLNGELYFSRLSQFNDAFEGITPTHYFVYQFANRGLGLEFDLSKPIGESSSAEEVMGTIMMSIGIYDLEKKLSRITGITDKSELSSLILKYLENMSDFIKPQFEFQNKHYTSCWFVNDGTESALMWSAYSEPNGIAVRIRYGDFKNSFEEYFNNCNLSQLGIERYYGGLIDYCDYNDPDDWLSKIENGAEPALFKQKSYEGEREFRFVLKRSDNFPEFEFTQMHKIVEKDSGFNIILHPKSGPDEMQSIRAKLESHQKLRVKMSELAFNY